MNRVTLLAAAGILLFGAGAAWTVHLSGDLWPSREARGRWTPGREAAAGVAEAPTRVEAPGVVEAVPAGTAMGGAAAPAAPPALPVNSQAAFDVANEPPQLPSNADERADRLVAIRKQRRETGIDQLNAREAARRARLGIATAKPAKGSQPPRPHDHDVLARQK